MNKKTIAKALIPALMMAASGCARFTTMTASEAQLLSKRQQSAYGIRELTLKDGSPIVFNAYDPAHVEGGRIESHIPVKDVEITKDKVEAIRRDRWGHPTEISGSDGLMYGISRFAEEPDRIFIRTGYLRRIFEWTEVSSLQMVKRNAGGTFALAGVGVTAALVLFLLRMAQGPL